MPVTRAWELRLDRAFLWLGDYRVPQHPHFAELLPYKGDLEHDWRAAN